MKGLRQTYADHRKLSLERIALYYQLKNFANQREIVWAIWDEHYKTLPPEPDQTEMTGRGVFFWPEWTAERGNGYRKKTGH